MGLLYKISFCTVSMNRLQHVMKTLPENMNSNKAYPNLEFVLLDYNSSDGLDAWIYKNFTKELSDGRLIFKRTDQPKYFQRSHSRNMAFKLATGDIVCNMDADNFAGSNFAEYINKHFQKNQSSFLSVNYNDKLNNISDTFGRIACFKKDFEEIGGFDERMSGYGYEDIDFCNRLRLLGREQHFVKESIYLKAIRHDAQERFGNENQQSGIKQVYINYISPIHSKIIFLFKDDHCAFGTLQDINEGLGNPTIQEGQWISGEFKIDDEKKIIVKAENQQMVFHQKDDTLIDDKGRVYYKILDKLFLTKLEAHYTIIGNHQIMVNNMNEERIKVNV